MSFESVEGAEHSPRITITNSYQYLLTAYIIQKESKESAFDNGQTQIYDALTRLGGLLAPIPRGLSHKIGIAYVGASVPDAKLVAAVWEDGSTFGPDELLTRISNTRKAQADRYDLAIATLQTGLEKNWSAQEYVTAAQQLRPPLPPQSATIEEARVASESLTAAFVPSLTLRDDMQHAVQDDSSPARVAKLAQILLKQFEESRDALRKALSGTPPSADQPIKR